MIGELANKAGEAVRERINFSNPLNQVSSMRQQVIDDVVAQYHRQITDKQHYVMKQKDEPQESNQSFQLQNFIMPINLSKMENEATMKSTVKRQSTIANSKVKKVNSKAKASI